MSYILEALKKSQQERDLGHVPTLAAEPFAKQKHPARGNPWVLTAFLLAVMAVVIALYAALGSRNVWQQAPESTANVPQRGEAAPTSPDLPSAQPGAATSLSPPPRISPHSGITGPAAFDDGSYAASPTYPGEHQDPYSPDAEMPYSDDDWDSMPPEPDAWVSDDYPARPAQEAPQIPSIPPDLHRDIEKFKRQALQEQYGIVPDQLEPPIQPTARQSPPAPQARGPNLDVARTSIQRRPPVEPTANKVIREERLPDNVLERLPERTVTVHVYSEDPLKRFVIIGSRRMIEGDRTPKGLVVEEIHPNGVVFRYEKHRFFRPR